MKLSSILKEYGLIDKAVKLVRHPYNKPDVKEIYDKGFIEDYQQEQGKPVFDKCDYILSFLGTNNTNAIFLGCYKIINKCEGQEKLDKMPLRFPYPEYFTSGVYYDMQLTDIMSDLINRLVIDWGKSTICWHQWIEHDKNIIAIYSPKDKREVKAFKSYDKTLLTYDELYTIVQDPITYDDWHFALSNVNCIYIILDKETGKQYIGSTYGQDGILGRWKNYALTKDGGDIGIKEELNMRPLAYNHFQYSILRVLPKTITPDEAISIETLYKEKLGSKMFGNNRN